MGSLVHWARAGGWKPSEVDVVGEWKQLADGDGEKIVATAGDDAELREGRIQVGTTSFANIEGKRIEWLWEKRIALGKCVVFAGIGGVNKSTVAYDLAARVSTGALAPLGEGTMMMGDVLIISGDDDPETDIRPRLEVAEANLARVHKLDIRKRENGQVVPISFDMSRTAELRAVLTKNRAIRLVVIDPVSAFVGKGSKQTQDFYSLVSVLNRLATEFRVATILITHLNKGGGKGGASFRDRVTGHAAWTDAARAGYLFTKDGSDADKRLMTCGKMNNAKEGGGLSYRVVEIDHPQYDKVIKIEWLEAVALTANEALEADADDRGSKLADAVEFLRARLADGKVASDDLFKEADDELGVSKDTMYDAKRRIGIVAKRVGFGKGGTWCWELPTPPPKAEAEAEDDRGF
jgi:putative DNA primase/helicase